MLFMFCEFFERVVIPREIEGRRHGGPASSHTGPHPAPSLYRYPAALLGSLIRSYIAVRASSRPRHGSK